MAIRRLIALIAGVGFKELLRTMAILQPLGGRVPAFRLKVSVDRSMQWFICSTALLSNAASTVRR